MLVLVLALVSFVDAFAWRLCVVAVASVLCGLPSSSDNEVEVVEVSRTSSSVSDHYFIVCLSSLAYSVFIYIYKVPFLT